jgi:hypothetical protein
MNFDELYNKSMEEVAVGPVAAAGARMAGRALAGAAVRKGISKLREAGEKTDVMIALKDDKIDPNLIVNWKPGHQTLKGEAAMLVLHYLWETYDYYCPWMYTLFENGLLEALNNGLKGAQVVVRDKDGNKTSKTVDWFSSETSDDPDWLFGFEDGSDAPWEEIDQLDGGVFFQDQDVDIDLKSLGQLVDKIKRAL